ncbi:hypothetical protein ACTFIZ_001736 [Dictyostelium cf. discoideum]
MKKANLVWESNQQPRKLDSKFMQINTIYFIKQYHLPSNILLNHENIFIECSLLVKGKGLESLLENKSNYNNEIQLLDKNYCSHILSSHFLLTTDYKGNNIFIEDNINKIIGIDDGECIKFDELNNSAIN